MGKRLTLLVAGLLLAGVCATQAVAWGDGPAAVPSADGGVSAVTPTPTATTDGDVGKCC
ncbi:hypothetical protein [Streptomyces sp. NPDC058955]|uniref:hypothetical protein n=1 Tax=unclassified Streptomyces TaxID=2593676 RepID=UPI0036477507